MLPAMKLVVGLGNPGAKYDGTRHNVGYEVLNELARRHSLASTENRFQGRWASATIGQEKVWLLWPTTYMNLSGASVLAAKEYYRVEDEGVLVICDDMNLPVGKLRLRAGGSSGGQKGLADVLRRLGTNQISRLRVGIGPPPENRDGTDYVLRKFSKVDRREMDLAVVLAADAIADWVRFGVDFCMNRYNSLTSG